MIDFKNGLVMKLKQDKAVRTDDILPLLVDGEEVLDTYTAMRDYVAFTNMRIISVNVQGVTGKKTDYTSLPYSKISAFSVETAGVLDLDSELELYFAGLGKVKFEFKGSCDIISIGKCIAKYALK